MLARFFRVVFSMQVGILIMTTGRHREKLGTRQFWTLTRVNKMSIPATGGKYLMAVLGCKTQVGQNNVCLKKAFSPGYFFIVNGSGGRKPCFWKGSHHFVFYPSSEKLKVDDNLKTYAIKIPPFSIFVGRGYLQTTGALNLEHHNLRNHVYLLPKGLLLDDSISFDYK